MPRDIVPFPELLGKATEYVRKWMANYDGSHDFNHIRRVQALSHKIATSSPPPPGSPPYNTEYITLAALLHDVGDRKYLKEGEDASTMVQNVLLDLGALSKTAEAVQKIATHVSYSNEIKNPAAVLEVIKEYPELAVVQDADRIDAIGAIGVGRAFTFSSANSVRKGQTVGMEESIQHFIDKLEKLEGMMKTTAGRDIARERTERLKIFRGWWEEEAGLIKAY